MTDDPNKKMNHVESERVSFENGRKLDEVILLLKGTVDSPGVLSKLQSHERALHGESGVVTRVAIMWRVHGLIILGFGTFFGYLLKSMAEAVAKRL